MKHFKTLGLALLVMGALMAFAGSPSAATATSPTGTEFTGEIEGTASSSLLLKAGFAEITCTQSNVRGKIESNAAAAAGKISSLSFGGCGGATVDVIQNGELSIASTGEGKGTVTGSGTQVTVSTMGTSCVYGTTTNTPLGTLNGGTPAKLTISASLPRISGGFLCANPAAWTGSYQVASLHPLLIDAVSPPPSPTLTSPTGTEFTGEIEATASSSLLLEAGFASLTCTESTIKGKIESNNTATAGGKISSLSFGGCGGATVHTLANGSLSFAPAGEGKATVTGSNWQVTTAMFGVSCVYGTTTNTPLGTLTGGTQAKLDISASIPKISGGFLCANPAAWTGSYQFTKPHQLIVDSAGPSSTTTATSPTGTEFTGEIEGTASSSLLLKAGFAEITCTQSTVRGKVESNGGTAVGGKITSLSFGGCGGATVDVIQNGELSIEATGEGKGIVRGSNTQVTVSTMGTSCVYGTTTNTVLGTVTGGTPAKMTISASLPRISGGFSCANPATWTGSYQVASLHPLLIDAVSPPPPTTLTSPTGTVYTGEIEASASGTLLLKAGFAEITCTESTAKGKIENHSVAAAGGKISSLSFSNCGESTVHVIQNGELSIASTGEGKGTVSGAGTQVTTARFGVSCIYGTAMGTTLGTLTGGTPATMVIKANLPKISGGFLCAHPASWSGSYTVTTPGTLLVD